ncbi:MAG: phosphoglycerate mutase [Acidimicrobiia bacterium]|nr:MAG: phosphoglycerate mutase [Acidimicrobiia bacterium]
MVRLVHLVRHGEVENPRHLVYASLPGFHLSELGRTQAEETASYLSSRTVAAVWSSPLERAVETAEVIARRHGLEVGVDERLGEWKMADRWAGHGWDELPAVFPGELEAYLRSPESLPGEPLSTLIGRMVEAVEELTREADGDVVVVSHQDPIQACLMGLIGLRGLHESKPGHCTVVSLRRDPWREVARWSPEDRR